MRVHTTIAQRSIRRATALAGAAVTAAFLVGCGGGGSEEPQDPPAAEAGEDAGEDDTSDGGDDAGDSGDDASDDDGSDAGGDDAGDGGDGEDLFAGTWSFHHEATSLTADELGAALADEAAERGPEEMTLRAECGEGIDTEAGDDEAECVAYADDGVEHLWAITAHQADDGLDAEVENIG